jgi:hypothetical protein
MRRASLAAHAGLRLRPDRATSNARKDNRQPDADRSLEERATVAERGLGPRHYLGRNGLRLTIVGHIKPTSDQYVQRSIPLGRVNACVCSGYLEGHSHAPSGNQP